MATMRRDRRLGGIEPVNVGVGTPKSAGFVTAETAVALPVVAFILTFILWAVAVGIAQIRVIDAARAGARAAARGEPDSQAIVAARLAAPSGASVLLTRRVDLTDPDTPPLIEVVVQARVGPELFHHVGISSVTATAFAEPEW
ncbi:MAG: pilus assembly protein [Acidothermus cellulolyticus]|nr:pilus assembly protein [Acidothermus cellulolyticus]